MSIQSAFSDFHNTVKTHLSNITRKYDEVNGSPGSMLFCTENGVEFDTLLNLSPMLCSTETIETAKGFAESFEQVFNTWTRISRSSSPTHNTSGDTWSLVANYDETQTWNYDVENDRILSTINSATFIGFISPKPIENYTVEVIVKSTSSDDDYIGLCIALAYDEQGRAHTLDVLAALMGGAPVTVNKDMGVERTVIAQSRDGLTWGDGSPATGSLSGNTGNGWSSVPDGVKLRVVREGDIVTIDMTATTDVNTYVPEARITLDLSSDSRLEVFRGPQQWGYVAQSQDGASWEVLQRPIEQDTLYNPSTGELHEWVDGSWSITTGIAVDTLLKPGRLYFNQLTEDLDYYDPDDLVLIPINHE